MVDTAEQVYISSLALLKVNNKLLSLKFVYRAEILTKSKMLKHGRAGVPMEVMGLMLGEFVDDYTVRVIDVFAMPQSGTVINIYIYVFSFIKMKAKQIQIKNLRALVLKQSIQYFKPKCWTC